MLQLFLAVGLCSVTAVLDSSSSCDTLPGGPPKGPRGGIMPPGGPIPARCSSSNRNNSTESCNAVGQWGAQQHADDVHGSCQNQTFSFLAALLQAEQQHQVRIEPETVGHTFEAASPFQQVDDNRTGPTGRPRPAPRPPQLRRCWDSLS